ncbi:MAG: AAA family ATPase [Chloroflexota bacterium]
MRPPQLLSPDDEDEAPEEKRKTPELREMLANIGEKLTPQAGEGNKPDVYQRGNEVEEILQALASPLKGRVVVLGPMRVGKSAVVQTVVDRIAAGKCPSELKDKEVWRLTPGGLMSFSTHGNWQRMFDQLLTEWAKHPEIILFFDEIIRAGRLSNFPSGGDDDEFDLGIIPHLMRRGGGIDLATLFATALKRNKGLCIAEAEDNSWRRFCDTYVDYEQLFLPIRVKEPDRGTTRDIVRHVADDLSVLHSIQVTDEAINQTLDLSQRYALDRAQPGKTIDLLRDSLAVTKTSEGAKLTAEDVIKRFGEQSGLPRMLLDDSTPFNEDEVLRYFKRRVLAQEQAVEAIVQSLSLLRARVNNPLRPMGVFLFLGPTGVGKTELARALAEYLFGNRERLVRFNMGDYAHYSQHVELFGNPYSRDVGGRRGQLTNRLSGKMFSVIVLDEFEKAHPVIYQRFLQLFDEGLMINGNDETINLRNAIMIITSNFGSQLIQHERIGFSRGETLEARETRVLSETEQYFTPEFMNRIDAVCIFHPLTRAVMADIARREISDLLQREGLTRREFEVDIADEVIEQVIALGYSPRYGARYLKRQIEKTITYPLARQINSLRIDTSGGAIRLYAKQNRIFATYFPPKTAEPESAATTVEAAPQTGFGDIRKALPILAARIEALEELHDIASARALRDSILAEMSDVNFWNDQGSARRKLDSYQRATSTVDTLTALRGSFDTLNELCAKADSPLDAAQRPYRFLSSELPRIEFTSWLSGPHDQCGAYMQIAVKSKLIAARQWSGTLAKMYLAWAKKRGLTASVVGEDQSPDGRALTITLAISGFGAYGLLQSESGTHRLVQIVKDMGKESMQRVAASVTVLPELPDDDALPTAADLEVSVKELNRAGVLLTRMTSSVSVRHAKSEKRLTLSSNLPPDDLTVEASRILRTGLYLKNGGDDSAPGGLARTYSLGKDKGVHDHRSGKRTAKIKQVLDGEIQDFLDEAMKKRAEK